MTSEQVAKVLSSLGKRKVCFQYGDKLEVVKGINVTNDNVILVSELPSGINRNNMTYEDFLKAFIDKNKSKVLRDRMFGGYDISKYDYDRLTDKCYEFISDKMNTEFPRPDINSEEYHDYYKNLHKMYYQCYFLY